MSIEEIVASLKSKRLEKTRVKDKAPFREQDNWKAKALAYKELLEKYSEFIELHEEKTIPELKALVTPKHEAVASLRTDLFEQLSVEYLEGDSFEKFVSLASDFVQSLPAIGSELSFSFWLAPEQSLKVKAGDSMDKALLLCSLLLSAEIPAKIRIVELNNGLRQPIVLASLGDRVVLCDCSGKKKPSFGLNDESVVGTYSFEGTNAVKSLYEYNDSFYKDFE
ncbi:hypothetical protein HUU53_00375 [Candidatus Micrarchaeota archaeon]|nr:hypothetical protein [Candidatus Micrarchaeota archaeon]